jgi:hypothetical protein
VFKLQHRIIRLRIKARRKIQDIVTCYCIIY